MLASHLSASKGKTKMSRLGSGDRVHRKTSGLVGGTSKSCDVDTGGRLHADGGGGDGASPACIHGSAETRSSGLDRSSHPGRGEKGGRRERRGARQARDQHGSAHGGRDRDTSILEAYKG
eukprot:767921-Hanusia_phi.AAC.2